MGIKVTREATKGGSSGRRGIGSEEGRVRKVEDERRGKRSGGFVEVKRSGWIYMFAHSTSWERWRSWWCYSYRLQSPKTLHLLPLYFLCWSLCVVVVLLLCIFLFKVRTFRLQLSTTSKKGLFLNNLYFNYNLHLKFIILAIRPLNLKTGSKTSLVHRWYFPKKKI